MYTINKIAKIAGITLKTLRHYEKVGLLVPSGRTDSGYRQYSEVEVEKLQQILFYRELDFPLLKIKEIMERPGYDKGKALKMQISFLEERAERYQKLSLLAKKTLRDMEGEKKMKDHELFEGFSYEKILADQKKYEKEVTEKWGNSAAYKESSEKTNKYRKEDWERIQMEMDDLMKELIQCFKEKESVESDRMLSLCDSFRKHMTTNFYECSLEMFSCLGNMYVTDERFTQYYDKHEKGLAAFYNEAIQNYCIKKA